MLTPQTKVLIEKLVAISFSTNQIRCSIQSTTIDIRISYKTAEISSRGYPLLNSTHDS